MAVAVRIGRSPFPGHDELLLHYMPRRLETLLLVAVATRTEKHELEKFIAWKTLMEDSGAKLPEKI